MAKLSTCILAAIAGVAFLFMPYVCAAATTGTGITEFGTLDLSLEIDPAVKDFSQDVSIEFQDVNTGRKYQYVFSYSQNYVIPDNPVKMIANATYSVETYIRDAAGVRVVGADGEPVTQIEITPEGAALVLVVMSDTADTTDMQTPANAEQDAGAAADPEAGQTGVHGDLSSLIPVMDRFYEKTAYAVNGDMVKSLELWTKISVDDGYTRDPGHTKDQWDVLSVYEKSNYVALVVIPFNVLFIYKDVHINDADKETFTKTLYQEIKYLQVAATDNGVYYDEICRVLDWEWDYYVKEHDFVNVIEEYAKLKQAGQAKGETTGGNSQNGNCLTTNTAAGGGTARAGGGTARAGGAGGSPARANGAEGNPAQTNDADGTPANVRDAEGNPAKALEGSLVQDGSPAQAPAASVSTPDNGQEVRNDEADVAKTIQKGFLDKLKDNIIPLAIGCLLLLGFFGTKKWNERHTFLSEEKDEREN